MLSEVLEGLKGDQAQHWWWLPYKQIEEEIRLLRVSSDLSSSAQFYLQDMEKEKRKCLIKEVMPCLIQSKAIR